MTDSNIIKIREPVEDYYIVWDGKYKLQRTDYNGPIRNKKTAETATRKLFEADAKITSIDDEIHYKISRIKVIAIASRDHSWMNDDFLKSQDLDEILRHEQLHFMVEEAFARKLQRELIECIKKELSVPKTKYEKPENTVRDEIENFLNLKREESQKETEAYQKEYDLAVHDARDNRIPEMQKQYSEKITKLLHDS